MQSTRIEHDSMGEVEVPVDARWGAQTQRAMANFGQEGGRFPVEVIHMVGLIKAAAATVSGRSDDVAAVDQPAAAAIRAAALEVAEGRWDDQFPVGVYQTGSGTSTNMNANEVIASRASELSGSRIDPNDHVNACQSSNDVIPSAVRLALRRSIVEDLVPGLGELRQAFLGRAERFAEVVKAGRTHLMDAAPVFLGDEMAGYADQIGRAMRSLATVDEFLLELPLGGTAVGTGLNAPAGWAADVRAELHALGTPVLSGPQNQFASQSGQEDLCDVSGRLRTVAVTLTKICNDLRLMASGPATGLGEIVMPALQPGSSMMPGKVNPVICESVLQVCARVVGNDATVTWGAASGSLELNTFMPVIAMCLLESTVLLGSASRRLATKCVTGIEADVERCRTLAEASGAVVTAAAPLIGYERAAAAVHTAIVEQRSVREVLLSEGVEESLLDELLSVERIARGGR